MDNSIYTFFETLLQEKNLDVVMQKMRDWFNGKKPLSKITYDTIIISIRIIYQEMLLVKDFFDILEML